MDPPELPLLDVYLLLARREETLFLEHIEHVSIRDIEVVVDHLLLEAEERHEIVREGPQVRLRHPPPSYGRPQRGHNLRHGHDGHRKPRADPDRDIKHLGPHSHSRP